MIDFVLFDLDNTLYPASSGLGLEMSRRMTEYVRDYLGVPLQEAAALRRKALTHHGTTLTWLCREHGLEDVEPYLETVHPIDLSPWITEAHAKTASDVLDALDVPAAILTNGPREHAMRVLERLGIASRFEALIDLRENEFVGKPARTAYERAIARLGITPARTLFVDDVVQYLLPFRDLGGRIVHLAEHRAMDAEVPTIASLWDLVDIIAPGRSRG